MNFATFGPFKVQDWSKSGLGEFFDLADAEKLGLRNAMGVYIITTRGRSGQLIPWYVGKTISGFANRLPQHLNSPALKALFSKRSTTVQIFLIARITGNAKFVKATARIKADRGLKSIDILEFTLIGSCLAKNAKLINARETVFHKLFHVPGYWNSQPKHYDNAASELAKMVGTKLGI